MCSSTSCWRSVSFCARIVARFRVDNRVGPWFNPTRVEINECPTGLVFKSTTSGRASRCVVGGAMVKNAVFALGWCPIGSSKRSWQLQVCVDVAEAARLVAALARFDGGGRWRVYDMVTVRAEAGGSVKLVRGGVVAEGVVRPGVQ